MNTDAQPLLLELADTMASGREIALTVGGFQIRGQVSLEGAHLHLAGREGTVTASRLLITNATVMGHGARLGGQQLAATDATVSWGDAGLRIRSAAVEIGALQVIGDHEPLDGTLVLEGITLAGLAVDGDEVRLAQLRVRTTKGELTLPSHGNEAPSREASNGSSPIVERLLAVLDRLTGHVNVDLGLDLTVPIIGRRRATHHFRIPIDSGAINYRQLEDNLSTLEDSLLDFSVRDEGLVLEVGIPFLPTRGKGKPIVTWTLDGEDLALANQQRVRLSVLTRPVMKNDDDQAHAESEEKSSPVSVRKAHAANLDVQLAVAPAESSLIHSVGALALVGDITYATDEATEGVLRATAQGVELGAFGAGRFSVTSAGFETASDVEVAFVGVTPVRAKLVAQNLHLEGLHVAQGAAPSVGTGVGGQHPHATHTRAK